MYRPFAGVGSLTRITDCVPSNATGSLQACPSAENETLPLYGLVRPPSVSPMKSTSVNSHGRLKSNFALIGLPITPATGLFWAPPATPSMSLRANTGFFGGSSLSRRKRFSRGTCSSLKYSSHSYSYVQPV